MGFTVRALFALQAFSRTMVALALVFFSFVELFVNRESIYVHGTGTVPGSYGIIPGTVLTVQFVVPYRYYRTVRVLYRTYSFVLSV